MCEHGISFLIFILITTKVPFITSSCSGEGQQCQLPFLYSGELHYECTTRAPGSGQDLSGRCPVRLLDSDTREASEQPSDWVLCGESCSLQNYTGNTEIETTFRSLALEFPRLVTIVEVGTSALGQNIVGIRISKGVGQERELLKPMVRYSGNMHGNEPVGRELLMHLASYLLRGYGVIDAVTDLVDNTDITLIPTINPDGIDRSIEGSCYGGDYKTGRFNEGNVDLNRDFPTWRDVNSTTSNIYFGRQPETQAMMDLILSEPWVLSANLHDGAVVASYPYDDYRGGQGQYGIHRTPDHRFFKHLATTYAVNHQTMLEQSVCPAWQIENGITNGADWYPIDGGMQDFNYLFSNDMEITLELSCCKYPKRHVLNREWERNKESLLEYLRQVHRGAKGIVRDTAGVGVAGADIVVQEINGPSAKNVTSSARGEFWKLLLPGQYRMTAYRDLCSTRGVILYSRTVEMTLQEDRVMVVLDLLLDRVGQCQKTPR